MRASELLGSWLLNRSRPEIAYGSGILPDSPSTLLQIKHGSLLAIDLCRLENVWPKIAWIPTQFAELDDLQEEFVTRGLAIRTLSTEAPISDQWTEIAFDMGVTVDYSTPAVDPRKLVISFSGDYPIGSEGDGQGKAIYRLICYLTDLIQPDALVIDLQNLHYSWGDALILRPPGFMFVDSRFAIVCSESQLKSLDFLGEGDRCVLGVEQALDAV